MKYLVALLLAAVEAVSSLVIPPTPPAGETRSPRPPDPAPPTPPSTAPPPPPAGEPVPLGTFEATCYALTGTTASGRPAGPGSIAVDRRVIPLGTRLVVEGYGPGDARDTGGAIKGHRVDVWLSTVAACRAWGRRSVRVWLAP